MGGSPSRSVMSPTRCGLRLIDSTNTACLEVGGGKAFVGIGLEETEAKDDAAYYFLLSQGSTASHALDTADHIPSIENAPPDLAAAGPHPSTLRLSDGGDRALTVRQVSPLSDEHMDWQPAGPTAIDSRHVDLRGGDEPSTERSVAVEVLESLRHRSAKIPPFLANTLRKALVTNTVASSLPASHPYFRKVWDLSQTSLSACYTLIGQWEMVHQGSSNAPVSIMDTEPLLTDTSFDDDFALMDKSGELEL